MTDQTVSFSLDEGIAIQKRLREKLQLAPEQFPLAGLVQMLGDEIDRMRDAGGGDAAVADVIREISGQSVTGEQIARHHDAEHSHGH